MRIKNKRKDADVEGYDNQRSLIGIVKLRNTFYNPDTRWRSVGIEYYYEVSCSRLRAGCNNVQ